MASFLNVAADTAGAMLQRLHGLHGSAIAASDCRRELGRLEGLFSCQVRHVLQLQQF